METFIKEKTIPFINKFYGNEEWTTAVADDGLSDNI